jgi:glutaredoxin
MKVYMIGAEWCGGCHNKKKRLSDLGIDYEYFDLDHDVKGKELVHMYNINILPAFLIFSENKFLLKTINVSEIRKLLEENKMRFELNE